jgi:hypothetical protein
VRKPVGRLPSGRIVTGVGDTLMIFDPIGGQGANNGTKMARHLVESVIAREDRPFDEAWMTETFDAFWNDQGGIAYAFNNLLLEPITAAGKELLIAQYGSDGTRHDGKQAIANGFAQNFADPRLATHTAHRRGGRATLRRRKDGRVVDTIRGARPLRRRQEPDPTEARPRPPATPWPRPTRRSATTGSSVRRRTPLAPMAAPCNDVAQRYRRACSTRR